MSELPPEPGTVPAPDLGVSGDAIPLPDGDAEVIEDYVYDDEQPSAGEGTGEDPAAPENSSSPLSDDGEGGA